MYIADRRLTEEEKISNLTKRTVSAGLVMQGLVQYIDDANSYILEIYERERERFLSRLY